LHFVRWVFFEPPDIEARLWPMYSRHNSSSSTMFFSRHWRFANRRRRCQLSSAVSIQLSSSAGA